MASFLFSCVLLLGNLAVSKKCSSSFGNFLSLTLELENFATADRSCCQQNSSTVELVGRRVVAECAARRSTVMLQLHYFSLS